MTTPALRFSQERRRQLAERTRITASVLEEIRRLLRETQTRIAAAITAQPTAWELHHTNVVRQAVIQAFGDLESRANVIWQTSLDEIWEAGRNLVDEPLRAGGALLGIELGTLSASQLVGTHAFMVERIADITNKVRTAIAGQLGLVVTGAQTPFQALTAVNNLLGGNATSRALTITRTEILRSYSVATQLRMAQAARVVPDLQKQWRRSGKLHSRLAHDLADGQVRNVKDAFSVGGEALMYPRDPTGSARNTVNCGCTALPYVEAWEVDNPGRRPFTEEEVAANPLRAELPST